MDKKKNKKYRITQLLLLCIYLSYTYLVSINLLRRLIPKDGIKFNHDKIFEDELKNDFRKTIKLSNMKYLENSWAIFKPQKK